MDSENSEDEPMNNTYINILELKKEFSVHEFAKSLLPTSELSEIDDHEIDEIESTCYGELLDDDQRKLEYNQISPVLIKSFETGRTWSHVRFKKKKIQDLTEELCYLPEPTEEDEVPHTQVSDKHEHTRIAHVLANFLEEENKSAVCTSNMTFDSDPVDISLIKSTSTKNKVFRFYYLDAYEKLFGEESCVYLFGKTYCHVSKSYKSCSVAVCPLKRRLFILPTAYVECGKGNPPNEIRMLKEFYNLALKPLNILEFKYRFVKKRNIEGIFLSEEQNVLEIQYSASYPAINQKIEGSTFSKVFGINDNCFENFLLEKNIKGPCWLDVTNPIKTVKLKTWSYFELSCKTEDILLCKSVDKSTSPPLTLFSFYLRTAEETNNLVLMSWVVNSSFEIWGGNLFLAEEKSYCTFGYVNCEEDKLPEIFNSLKRTKIQTTNTEKDLILIFLEEFNKADPDIVVVYDIHNEQFHKFMDRIESLKIENRSKLGKFRFATSKLNNSKFLFSGRLVCDLRHLSKEFTLAKNYELNELYKIFLGIKEEDRIVADFEGIISPTGKFQNILENEKKFLEIFVLSTNEAIYLLKLVLKTNIIPLAVKLTEICGNILSQTFSGSILKRNEYLLLHTFHEQNFILPNRIFGEKSKNTEDSELLTGGLVLEPKIGFYDNYIVLMDFQSLYPSIIHEYNLCISHNTLDDFDSTKMPQGVLPKLMSNLVSRRKNVKEKMNILSQNSTSHFRYQIYQKTLKTSANGIYGCLASPYFRFYCPSIAQEITRRARAILSEAVNILEKNQFQIIYGDTDSMMVNTMSKDLKTAMEMGQEIRKVINAQYSSVNLKIDSIFEKLLIITKKKYAGVAVNMQNPEVQAEIIMKGLNITRYDWPEYVCKIGEIVIGLVLSNFSLEEKRQKIKEQLCRVQRDLLNNKVERKSLVITKYLTQDPKYYSKDTSHPHAQVAIRCNENSLFNFKSGDAVPFIMCCDKNKAKSQRAYHLEELKNCNNLMIDGSYYLQKQVYPFVSNICSHIGLRTEDIEECLQLKNPPENNDPYKMNEIEFERRDPIIFDCITCGEANIFDKSDEVSSKETEFLNTCMNTECGTCPLDNLSYVKNKLVITIISYIQKYYKYEMKCSNERCLFVTSRIPLSFGMQKKVCPRCDKGTLKQIYTETDLFLQLEYFKYILNDGLNLTSDERKRTAFKSLLQVIDDYVQHSGFLSVNLARIFDSFQCC